MNWYKKAAQIVPFTQDADSDEDDHGIEHYDMMDQADEVFSNSNIHPGRSKQYTHMAIENGVVVGAIQSDWHVDKSENLATFEFDVAVDKKFRNSMTGLKLIAEAINYYDSDKYVYKEMGHNVQMRVWVVNTRLVPVLENRYGFQIESQYSNGSAHMVRY